LKTVAAAAVMGIFVFLLNRYFHGLWEEMNFWQELISLVVCILAGIVSYFGCCRLLRVKEIRFLFGWLRN